MLKDHMPWIVVLLIAMIGGFITVSHRLVDNGEARLTHLETRVAQLEKFCCSEIDEFQ